MIDVAARIRARAGDWVENCLDPQATAKALLDLLDLCDRVSTDFEGKPSLVGQAFATEVRSTIANALGVADVD